MYVVLCIIAIISIVMTILPLINNQHWIFRTAEFMVIQVLIVQLLCASLFIVFVDLNSTTYLFLILLGICIAYHIKHLLPYSILWNSNKKCQANDDVTPIEVISCNVLQYNTHYDQLISLVQSMRPHLLLTMESDHKWEEALRNIEQDYPHTHKVTLDNTYGMHLYSRLPFVKAQTHYFVSDDIPSIEARMRSPDGPTFTLFAVHPPPPSPTEEETSKERDGDLLSIAKYIQDIGTPVIACGDFNTVAWAKVTQLFRKTSGLIDARIGRGLLATFHAHYFFFRVPLDLLFHSANICLHKMRILPNIRSDHFPVYFSFHVINDGKEIDDESESLSISEQHEVEELIQEGIEEESDNRD